MNVFVNCPCCGKSYPAAAANPQSAVFYQLVRGGDVIGGYGQDGRRCLAMLHATREAVSNPDEWHVRTVSGR